MPEKSKKYSTIRYIMISTMTEKTDLSTLSLAILGLIAQKSCSGYDIRKIFSTTPMGHFSASPGAIYPALKRIEKNGWAQGKTTNEKTLRPKLMYSLTKKGQAVLKRHVSHRVTRHDVIWRMDDLMLRFAFMDNVVGRKKTLEFLTQFLREVESYLASLNHYFETSHKKMPANGRLAMENGIENYKMHIRWAKKAIKELQKG